MTTKEKKLSKNNIVVYFSDQQRPDTIGCYGQPLDITPNLNKLDKEEQFFKQGNMQLIQDVLENRLLCHKIQKQ